MSNSTYYEEQIKQLTKERDQAQERLKGMLKFGQAMYNAAQRLTTDASQMRSAMEAWHKFIIKKGEI